MSKFLIQITLDDGTVIDDVTAEMPDQIIAHLVAAAEGLGRVDAENSPITGGRAITVAIRWFLTNLVSDYSNSKAAELARVQASAAVSNLLESIVIKEG